MLPRRKTSLCLKTKARSHFLLFHILIRKTKHWLKKHTAKHTQNPMSKRVVRETMFTCIGIGYNEHSWDQIGWLVGSSWSALHLSLSVLVFVLFFIQPFYICILTFLFYFLSTKHDITKTKSNFFRFSLIRCCCCLPSTSHSSQVKTLSFHPTKFSPQVSTFFQLARWREASMENECKNWNFFTF